MEKLLKNKISKIVKEILSENFLSSKSYRFHDMEIAEYTRFCPYKHYPNLSIFMDESNSYRRWKHPMWVIVCEGNPYTDFWYALSISSNPKILVKGNQEGVGKIPSTINLYKKFVSNFHSILEDIAKEKVDSSVIYDIIDNVHNNDDIQDSGYIQHRYNSIKHNYFLESDQRSVSLINEMAILRPQLTKLPCCLWIEQENRTTQNNVPRIKFQDGDSKISNDFYPILLTDNGVEIADTEKPCKAKTKTINTVFDFVKKYREILEGFIYCKITEQEMKTLIKNGVTQLPRENGKQFENGEISG